MRERIKQELKAELPEIIKPQLLDELRPEIQQKLDEMPGKLLQDEPFKSGLKDAIKAALLADDEFKSAMSDAVKIRFTSDAAYQKEWITVIAAAIQAKQDGDANGYPMDVNGIEVRVKQEGEVPKSLSFAASASLTNTELEQALGGKYGGSWATFGYATSGDQTTAQISPIS
jgi:hypothetical protein